MEKNLWDNYLNFMKPQSASTNEINAWLQSTMGYMDDFVSFSKKVCEMKATPDDVMMLWENSSKKIQTSVADCMKILGFPDNAAADAASKAEIDAALKKLEAAQKSIEDYKKKIKDQEKDLASQKKENEKQGQLLSEQKKENEKLTQLLSEQKKEITKLQQSISALEEAAVKAATPKTSQ